LIVERRVWPLDVVIGKPRAKRERAAPGAGIGHGVGPAPDQRLNNRKAGQRIAAVVLQELQEADPMITAKVLNHVEGGPKTTHVYNRYRYDREKKVGLETWERVLTGILTNTSSANVPIFTQAPAIKASK
jgi:hypothetical protein